MGFAPRLLLGSLLEFNVRANVKKGSMLNVWGLTHGVYTAFGNSSIVWICNHCGAHNISKTNLGISSLSNTHFTQNTFDVLDNSNDIQHKHSNSSDPRSPGSPVLSSSPLHSRPMKANSKKQEATLCRTDTATQS